MAKMKRGILQHFQKQVHENGYKDFLFRLKRLQREWTISQMQYNSKRGCNLKIDYWKVFKLFLFELCSRNGWMVIGKKGKYYSAVVPQSDFCHCSDHSYNFYLNSPRLICHEKLDEANSERILAIYQPKNVPSASIAAIEKFYIEKKQRLYAGLLKPRPNIGSLDQKYSGFLLVLKYEQTWTTDDYLCKPTNNSGN